MLAHVCGWKDVGNLRNIVSTTKMFLNLLGNLFLFPDSKFRFRNDIVKHWQTGKHLRKGFRNQHMKVCHIENKIMFVLQTRIYIGCLQWRIDKFGISVDGQVGRKSIHWRHFKI